MASADMRPWLLGGLAALSLWSSSGAMNRRDSLMLSKQGAKLMARNDDRGRRALFAQPRGSTLWLRLSSAESDDVEVLRSPNGFHVISRGRSSSGQPHVGWEWFGFEGELRDDKFLVGRREIERYLGRDAEGLDAESIANMMYTGMRAPASK